MKQTPWIWILIVAFFGTVLYFQAVGFDYTLDDGIYATANQVTRKGLDEWQEVFKYGSMNFIEISPTNTGIYRPFTLLTFALENELVGKFDPRVSHSINLILYFGLLVVLGFLLSDLTKTKKLFWWIPALILLLYAVHPLHVEVVASVKSRDTLLSSLFAFGAILIWWRTQPRPKIWHWVVVLGLYFLSLLSKEESIPLIALVGLIAYFFLGKKPLKAAIAALPFAGAATVYMFIRSLVLDRVATIYDSYINSILYLADGSERLATNFYIYLEYLKLLFFPHPLSWDYSFSQLSVQNFGNGLVWLSVAIFGGLIWVAFKGFKHRSLISFGLIFYFATFSIFANLLPSLTIGSNLGERFLFVPSLGFAFLVVYGLFLLGEKWLPHRQPLLPMLVLIPVLLGFSWKTVDRTKVWKDNLTITRNDVQSSPKSWRTHTFYAEELRREGLGIKKDNPDSARTMLQEARKEYEIMFGILGKDLPVSQYLATYAEVLINLGDSAMAVAVLEENIKKNSKAFYPLFQLGRFSFEEGEYEKAIGYYQKALQSTKPDFGPLYRNLGLSYSRNSQKDRAIVALQKSLEYFDSPEVRRALGYIYSELGDAEKAAQYLSSEEISSPEEVQFLTSTLRGNEALGKKDFKTSLAEYQKIEPIYDQVDGKAKFPTFYAAYAKSLIETGDTVRSKAFFLRAVEEMDSKDPVVYTNLGTIAYSKDRNYGQAERYFQQALDYGATSYESYMNLASVLLVQRKERQAIPVLEKAVSIQATRAAVGNLYLVHKSLGNTEQMNRYYQMLFPAGVPQ